MPTLYLSGPMTGVEEFNAPAFRAAAGQLREAGYGVISPTDNGLPCDAPWTAHLRADIPALCKCDAVALVIGRATREQVAASRGRALELHIAQALGMRCAPVADWLRDSGFVAAVWLAARRQAGAA